MSQCVEILYYPLFFYLYYKGQITPTLVKAEAPVEWQRCEKEEEDRDTTAAKIHQKKWYHRYLRSLVVGASSVVTGIIVFMLVRRHQKLQKSKKANKRLGTFPIIIGFDQEPSELNTIKALEAIE